MPISSGAARPTGSTDAARNFLISRGAAAGHPAFGGHAPLATCEACGDPVPIDLRSLRTSPAVLDKNSPMTKTDAEIIARSLEDPEAFGTIFDRHVTAIHGYLARRTGPEGGDSLTGEVFRIAFEVRGRYRPDRACALPWLYGIAANVLRQHARSEHRQWRLAARLSVVRPMTTDLAVPKDIVAHEEAVSLALEAVETLPEAERETLLLFALEALSYEQISVALDVPLGTVRSRLSRARARVREHLASAAQKLVDTPRQHDWRRS